MSTPPNQDRRLIGLAVALLAGEAALAPREAHAEEAQTLPSKPAGLLSFLYWVKHDPDYNRAFHRDLFGTLELFGLRRDGEIAMKVKVINAAHDDEAVAKKRIVELFEQHLIQEVLSGPPRKFW